MRDLILFVIVVGILVAIIAIPQLFGLFFYKSTDEDLNALLKREKEKYL